MKFALVFMDQDLDNNDVCYDEWQIVAMIKGKIYHSNVTLITKSGFLYLLQDGEEQNSVGVDLCEQIGDDLQESLDEIDQAFKRDVDRFFHKDNLDWDFYFSFEHKTICRETAASLIVEWMGADDTYHDALKGATLRELQLIVNDIFPSVSITVSLVDENEEIFDFLVKGLRCK